MQQQSYIMKGTKLNKEDKTKLSAKKPAKQMAVEKKGSKAPTKHMVQKSVRKSMGYK